MGDLIWTGYLLIPQPKEPVSFKVLRPNGMEFSHIWNPTAQHSVGLGILGETIGPREWSPRRGIPEGFKLFFEVLPEDRLTILVGGEQHYRSYPSRDEGFMGVFAASSPTYRRLVRKDDAVYYA